MRYSVLIDLKIRNFVSKLKSRFSRKNTIPDQTNVASISIQSLSPDTGQGFSYRISEFEEETACCKQWSFSWKELVFVRRWKSPISENTEEIREYDVSQL